MFSERHSRIRGAGLAALCLLLAAALPAQAPEGKGTKPKASIFFCSTDDVQCRTKINEFALDDIRDLFVFSAWKHVDGEHTQELRFLLPDGNLYQKIETKFTTQESAKKQGVRATVKSREEAALSVALPVAGTHITQRSLAGTWTVELFLDGHLVASSELIFKPRPQP